MQEHSNTQRTPYLYTGKELDEETGLYYYGARYYDPRTSVWASADPILGRYLDGNPNYGVFEPANLGLFTYVRNNPIRLTDPDGESFGDFLLGIGNGFNSSVTLGTTPRMQGNTDLRLGQMVGDTAAIFVGFGMMDVGGGMMGGGGAFAVATSPTGVGAAAGAAVAAGGVAVAGAGAAVAGKGATNLGTGLGVVLNEALNGDAKGAANGPRAGKKHTPAANRLGREINRAANGGELICPTCGKKMNEPVQSKRGVPVDRDAAVGDHVHARSQGGDGATVQDMRNHETKCWECNSIKSDN